MKINKKTSYPYPIWGWSDDYTLKFNDDCFQITEVEDKDDYVYNLELLVHNPDIDKCVDEENAVYACSIDCASTFYHDFISSADANFQIRIPRQSVNKKIEVKWMVIATKAITNYQSESLNPDYGGRASFPKGAMLAYITSFEIYPVLSGELHSFDELFVVVKNQVSNDIEYRLDYDKITIALPQEQLEIFKSAAGQKFSSVLHATIVEKALLYALCKIQDYSTKLWADILSQYIDLYDDDNIPSWEDIKNGDADLSIDNSFKIINDMLKDPIKRALSNISFVYEELKSSND